MMNDRVPRRLGAESREGEHFNHRPSRQLFEWGASKKRGSAPAGQKLGRTSGGKRAGKGHATIDQNSTTKDGMVLVKRLEQGKYHS